MNKVMKAVAALMLMAAVFFAAGCTKDPNHNNEVTVPMVKVTEIVVDSSLITHFSGAVVSDGGDSIIRCGFCWGTQEAPDINGDHNVCELCDSTFSGEAGQLGSEIFYVRAYAVNSKGIGYSDEVSFVPIHFPGDNDDAPTGAINGKFTINENGDQVYFSQGNLQYQASTNTWRFAERQWDYVGGYLVYNGELRYYGTVSGSCNNDISPTYSGWIDLFGWGTSGWNCGNTYYQPWDYDYYDVSDLYGPQGSYDLTGEYAHSDWGVHNPISNGGNVAGQWRTLTYQEWLYVVCHRYNTSSEVLFTPAQVEGVNGLILLPDDWSDSFYPLALNPVNDFSVLQYYSNVISASDWMNCLQAHGAVFLPAAGFRMGNSIDFFPHKTVVGFPEEKEWDDRFPMGVYWSASSSQFFDDRAYPIQFGWRSRASEDWERCVGASVRLVCPAE